MRTEPSWRIPGYAVDQLVVAGPRGDVWTGRVLAGGAAVTFEEADPVPGEVLDLLRLVGRFPPGGHPHLWPVRDVAAVPGRTVLVRDRAPGGSLAALLVHRGRLRPGEVVTILAPLASALAFLHGEQVVHSAITPERILFDADGRPALAGIGTDFLLGAGGPETVPADNLDPAVLGGMPASAATDVFMLASCGLAALGDTAHEAPAALRDTLHRALRTDPAERPSAAEFAATLGDAWPAEAVRLLVPEPAREPTPEVVPELSIPPAWLAPDRRVRPYLSAPPDVAVESVTPKAAGEPPEAEGGPPPHEAAAPPASGDSGGGPDLGRPRTGRRRTAGLAGARSRRLALALVVAALLVVAGAVWFRLPVAAPGPLADPAPARPVAAAERWLPILDDLDATRAQAYERGEVGLLSRVWAPGPRLRADTMQLSALLSSGCTARGVRHRFGTVDVLALDGRRVRLRVRQWLPASQRLRAGRVVGELAGSPPAIVPLDLVATDEGWRLG